MALRRVGEWWYGDSQDDIREVLLGYSQRNGYPATEFADAVCPCGGRLFRLSVDEERGAAVRRCEACSREHPIADSQGFLAGAELQECGCPCGSNLFEITAGVALYQDSEDVRWLYLGCRCPECGLTACYGDWKNEYFGFRELLSRI
jgi:hypothetical protein